MAPAGKLLATLPAAQGRLDSVSACCVTGRHDHVAAGDTAGHIRVWDLREGVDTGSMRVSICDVGFLYARNYYMTWVYGHKALWGCVDTGSMRVSA